MVHHKYQYLFIQNNRDLIKEDIYIYNRGHISIFDHMVHYMAYDYMVLNINEYIWDVYICKHMAK